MIKKNLFRVVIFLIALIVCDSIFGLFSKMLFNTQKSGKYARLTYIIKTDTSDIIVLGSSHANRQFVSDIIQDSLKESTFNCGTMGQKLLFNRAIYEFRERRSRPKMILLNVDEDWFLNKRDQQDRMSDLYPYYGSMGDIIFEDFSRKDRLLGHLKLLSKTFPYNSTIVHIIKYRLKPQDEFKGYAPLSGVLDSLQLALKINSEKGLDRTKWPPDYDSSLVNLFSQFVDDINRNNIRLFIIFTPNLLKPYYPKIDEEVREICNNKNIPLIDFSNTGFFYNNRPLFDDFSHLNDSGSRIFTKLLVDSIKLKMAH